MLLFLTNIGGIEQQEKKDFIMKMDADEKIKRNVGETLIMIIDQMEDFNKPKMLANLFTAYVRGIIDYDKYLRLSKSLNRVFIEDLIAMLEFLENSHQEGEMEIAEKLYGTGLSDIEIEPIFGETNYLLLESSPEDPRPPNKPVTGINISFKFSDDAKLLANLVKDSSYV